MQFRASYLLKLSQIVIIVIILWRIFSDCEIRGHFVPPKEVLRQGIQGTCRRLFFYFPPQTMGQIEVQNQLPRLRLWWVTDGQRFLPPQPAKEAIERMTQQIKGEISQSTVNFLTTEIGQEEEEQRAKRGKANSKNIEIHKNSAAADVGFIEEKKHAIMPDEEEKPAELLELDQQSEGEATNCTEMDKGVQRNCTVAERLNGLANRSNLLHDFKRRAKRNGESNPNGAGKDELPWLSMQKTALLPHEESKLRSRIINDQLKPIPAERTADAVESPAERWLMHSEEEKENDEHRFKLNLQEFGSNLAPVWNSPLAKLASRTVATLAVGLSHLLLLFAQVYLLNCLEVDNLEQRRGKLFLELLIVLLGCLGWLVVVLLKVRTELRWEAIWMCTNFRPQIIKELIVVQVLASALLLLGIVEGVHIFLRMRKCVKKIEAEQESDMKPQRPPI